MAEISFGTYNTPNLNGSGLGFYGSSFGSSVQIGAYQDKTFITNADGTINGGNAYNFKFTAAASGIPDTDTSGIPLSRLNSHHRTLDINFTHSTPVNVQNAQLRIYDRVSINNPASGVNTKVAELVNFNGQAYATWVAGPGSANTSGDGIGGNPIGSGDHVWWGEAWPSNQCAQFTWQNSSGIVFRNGSTADPKLNGDSRLGALTGDDDTVGGSGIVVPLLDNPGSGQRFLDGTYDTAYKPKWLQYYNTSSPNLANIGANSTTRTFGGTGVDTRHTWRVAISATPLTVGSKSNYALQFSCEYL
jgi:hypothetical protein